MKLLAFLTSMVVSSGVYACKTVIIDTPKGTTVCYICADGKIINCDKLQEKMMHCTVCDKLLNDYEATRKTLDGKYLDMCQDCYTGLEILIPTIDRKDLLHETEMPSPDAEYDYYQDSIDLDDFHGDVYADRQSTKDLYR